MPSDILSCEDAVALNKWLSLYVIETRKQDDGRYPASTLNLLLCGLKRHMKKVNPAKRSSFSSRKLGIAGFTFFMCLFNSQRSKFKVEAGCHPPSCFVVSITYKDSHLFSATASSQDRMSLGTGSSGFWAIRQSAHASKFLTAQFDVGKLVLAGTKPSEKVANWSLV